VSSRPGPPPAAPDAGEQAPVRPAAGAAGPRPGPWAFAGAALYAVLLAYLVRLPCRLTSWEAPGTYLQLCYSDLPTLYASTGMAEGRFPYLDPSALLEYPVLQTVVASATGLVAHALSPAGSIHAGQGIYFDVNALLLGGLWAAVVLVLRRMGAGTVPVLLAALAPGVVVTALINWDLWPVLCTVLALLALRRSRWVLGGVLLGLGTAFKLFPFLVLGALVVLAVRRREPGPALRAAAGAAGAWAATNLPLLLLDPRQWGYFWSFSEDRGAGFSSVWHWWNGVVVPRLGSEPLTAERVNVLAFTAFGLACVLVLALGLAAREEPSLEQLAFLVLAAFVLTNKVYSPQFVLWLVPLLVLARFRTAEFVVWQLVEVVHWAAVFTWLGHATAQLPGTEAAEDVYFATVALHTAAVGWLVVRVAADVLRGPGGEPRGGER